MAPIELTGLVDPSQPLDPAAHRALAARELKRLGPTPGGPPPPAPTDWTEAVRRRFSALENEHAREILECVLDPVYCSFERPESVDRITRVYVERAMPGSELPDRLHNDYACRDALATQTSASGISGSIWALSAERVFCPTCMDQPDFIVAGAIRGRDRHRVNIRTNVLAVLDQLQHGVVHWPAVQRLAALGTERWLPRYEHGFVDTGNPQRLAPDPIADATVALAVAVGQATGQHLAALWDAAMVVVLTDSGARSRGKIRRRAGRVLAAVLDGHTWDELSGDLVEFEDQIKTLVADELDHLETDHPSVIDWTPALAHEAASDDTTLRSRMVMSWHGGPVPATIITAAAKLHQR